MHDIFCHQGPQEVETGRVLLFVLDPATLLQGSSHVTIAALDDKDFRVLVNSVLPLPLLHIGYVQLHSFYHGLVALKEVIEGLAVSGGPRLGCLWACCDLLDLFVPPLLKPAVLLLPESRQVLYLLGALLDLLSSLLLQPLLPLELCLLFLLLIGYL